MGSTLRKVWLTAHVVVSVGCLGAAASFLAIALVGATSDDEPLVRGVFRAMEPMTNFVIVPLAIASLLTGVVQALATPWGLFRHYWVVIKFFLTVFATLVLLDYPPTVSSAALEAADPTRSLSHLRTLSAPRLLHAGGGSWCWSSSRSCPSSTFGSDAPRPAQAP